MLIHGNIQLLNKVYMFFKRSLLKNERDAGLIRIAVFGINSQHFYFYPMLLRREIDINRANILRVVAPNFHYIENFFFMKYRTKIACLHP